jgi:hypothetical protein
MWNKNPEARQVRLDRETQNKAAEARLRRVLREDERYDGTRPDVKRVTGQDRIEE